MDIVNKDRRSEMMAGIKSRNTQPERLMRSALHRLGFRFRLHRGKALPGKPDIVLTKYKAVVFVNGCFWHRHPHCRYAYTPKSHIKFWKNKFSENRLRDVKAQLLLRQLGWRVFVVWECQIFRSEVIAKRIGRTIRGDRKKRHPVL